MQAAEADTRNMKPLMAVVIIMGVLIVAGIVVVIATIANRMSGGGREATPTRAEPGFATVDLPVPAGCQVMETTTADDRLILRLGSGERCNQILIVDMATGRLLGTLRLVTNPE
jgi:hypothetical protein